MTRRRWVLWYLAVATTIAVAVVNVATTPSMVVSLLVLVANVVLVLVPIVVGPRKRTEAEIEAYLFPRGR